MRTFGITTAPTGRGDGYDIADTSQVSPSEKRKHESSSEVVPETRCVMARRTSDAEAKLMVLVRDLETTQVYLRTENSRLLSERDENISENNRLRLILQEQQEAIMERNKAIQLLLEQPGIKLQQQQQGSLLTSPDEPSFLSTGTIAPTTNPASEPSNLTSIVQVPTDVVQEQQHGGLIFLLQQEDETPKQPSGHSMTLARVPSVSVVSDSSSSSLVSLSHAPFEQVQMHSVPNDSFHITSSMQPPSLASLTEAPFEEVQAPKHSAHSVPPDSLQRSSSMQALLKSSKELQGVQKEINRNAQTIRENQKKLESVQDEMANAEMGLGTNQRRDMLRSLSSNP